MGGERKDGVAEQLVFAVLVMLVVVPRLLLSACVTDFGADGSFYTNVAQHVRDGDGLATDVSVFHHAFRSFPHPTSTYPLWPLVYGTFAKFSPLTTVAVWLPTTLYFVAIVLAYVLGHRLAPRSLLGGLPLHGGHVLAALFALNPEFALATARPYTEGLAFVLLLSLLLRGARLWRELGFLAGAELGLWLIALFLTRSQFVVVGLAALATLPIALLRSPRQAGWFLLGAAMTATFVWQLYAAWLGTFLPHPTLGTYLRLDLARVGEELSVVPFLVETGSVFGRVLDLVQSLGWAFSLHINYSYHALFHGAGYALPVAAGVLLSRWRRAPVVWRLLRGPSGANIAFFHLVALALCASLHTIHQIYGPPWIFGSRLGIPAVLLIGAALIYLLGARHRLPRALGFFFLSAGLYGSWVELVRRTDDDCARAMAGESLSGYRVGLRKFLQSERERLGELIVAVERPEAQHLSWRTQDIGFHWLSESTTVDDLSVMVDELGVRYIILFSDIDNVVIAREAAFQERFIGVPLTGVEGRVYAPRCSVFPDAPTCIDDTGAP